MHISFQNLTGLCSIARSPPFKSFPTVFHVTMHRHTSIGRTYRYNFKLTSWTWRNHALGFGRWRRRFSSESISLPWWRRWRRLRTVYISVGRGDPDEFFKFKFFIRAPLHFHPFLQLSFRLPSPRLQLSVPRKRFFWQWSILSLSSFKILAIFCFERPIFG